MIGQLLLSYGMLDQLVFNVLQRELPVLEYSAMKKRHLTDRVERMMELLSARAVSKTQHEELKQWCEAFGAARDLRNHLAHGFLLLTTDADMKTPCLKIRQARDLDACGGEGLKQVGFDELSHCFDQLNELIERLGTWAGYQQAPLPG